MLAFMPQQSPSASHHMSMANTMSLAVLPSTPLAHTSAHAHPSSPPKRPRLSLNTANVPSTFGKKSTSLRLDTLSATSPTARNTFSNATLNPQGAPSTHTQRPVLRALATSVPQDRESSPTVTATSSHSASSASTIESSSGEPPYSLSYHLQSILSNGPIPRGRPQKTSFGQPKSLMFPAPKKVAFRTPLEEEVTTSKYTMRHIDIESSTSTISTLALNEEEAQSCDSATVEDQKSNKSLPVLAKKTSPTAQTGEKRESSDEEDSDTPAATPIAGRRKRSRHWVWTLPPVSSSIQTASEVIRKCADSPARA